MFDTDGGAPMTFLIHPAVPFYGSQLRARTRDTWRIAADLVWTRWEFWIDAMPETRGRAFAAYTSALDAEAAAAAALADLQPTTAV
jgi:hypothetical protein